VFYSLFVARTHEECEKELAAPQRSLEWLQARKLSITASQFGVAIGVSPYQTPDELVIEKLWNTFEGNAATQWGNSHEIHAKEVFCEWFKTLHPNFTFMEENLMKFSAEPWMAVSPDGIVKYEKNGEIKYDLVEFKCPAYLRNTQTHPYAKNSNIPPQYKAQIQGIMGYLNTHTHMKFERCWFVVWQPHQTWITEDLFDQEYYLNLHAKLESWYFSKMLPSFTHQFNGLLIKGLAQPQEEMII
jgi:putative phage-type endonuclease